MIIINDSISFKIHHFQKDLLDFSLSGHIFEILAAKQGVKRCSQHGAAVKELQKLITMACLN